MAFGTFVRKTKHVLQELSDIQMLPARSELFCKSLGTGHSSSVPQGGTHREVLACKFGPLRVPKRLGELALDTDDRPVGQSNEQIKVRRTRS